MKHSQLGAVVTALITISTASESLAQTAQTLDTVIVTANRIEQSEDHSLASVTVIDRQAIERSQAGDLLNLLSRQTGIDVSRNGGRGALSTVFMRGSNSNHTMVLINGVRVNATGQGLFDFSLIPLAQIERIEIVRGPRAALWGSDAIGGVIHIFTRAPDASFASALVGSQGLAGASAGTGINSEHGQLGLALGLERSTGINASSPSNWSFDPDRDGYRNRNASMIGRTSLGTYALSGFILNTDADVEFDQGETFGDNLTGGVSIDGRINTRWSHTLSLGYSRDRLNTPAYGSRINSQRLNADWINQLALDDQNRVLIGLNWSQELGESLSSFSGSLFDQTRENRAAFGQWLGDFTQHQLEVAVRHDDNQQFGHANTAQAAWGWTLSESLNTRLSWGEAYRAPSFNELYSPGFGGLFAGNAMLQPEESQSLELGLNKQLSQHQSLKLSLYRSDIDQLISFSGVNFQATNIERARLKGAELEYLASLGNWQLSTSVTWQRTQNLNTGDELLRRAPRKGSLGLSYRFAGGTELGADWQATSRRQDFDGPLGAYSRLDIRAQWQLSGHLKLMAKIENALDHDYQLASGFASPGRSFLIELLWNANN